MSWGRFCTTVNHTLFEYPSLRKFVEDLEILTQITATLDYVIYINKLPNINLIFKEQPLFSIFLKNDFI